MKDPQSGGNLRITTPTSYVPKELATVSRIEAYSGDPYQLFDVQENFGETNHRSLRDTKISETSYFQSHMHFDDSVEGTADSELED